MKPKPKLFSFKFFLLPAKLILVLCSDHCRDVPKSLILITSFLPIRTLEKRKLNNFYFFIMSNLSVTQITLTSMEQQII
jgi:hypothetical protein